MIRLFELKFKVFRQTVLNWLTKGAAALKKLFPVLKTQALEKDSIINCDETWCRVKMQDKYKKAYIWCLVNKVAGIFLNATTVTLIYLLTKSSNGGMAQRLPK